MPLRGRLVPPPIWLLAKAISNEPSMPITSPVDFISGPEHGVDAGEAREGEHGFLHRAVLVGRRRSSLKLASFSPAMTRAAILATGMPITLATKGTVREARGLTSST